MKASHRASGLARTLLTVGLGAAGLPALLGGLRQARTTGPGLVTLSGVDHLLHPAGTATNDQILAPAAVAALRSFLAPY